MANWDDTLVDNVDSITAAMWNNQVKYMKRRPIMLTAYTAIISSTNGVEINQEDMGTNTFPVPYGLFQASTTYKNVERLNWITHLSTDVGDVTFNGYVIGYTTANTANNTVYNLFALRFDLNTALTATLSSVATFTLTGANAYCPDQSTETSITVADAAGSTDGTNILWELRRSTLNDTSTYDNRFLALCLYPV